jgi:hypothetical protein
MVILASGNVGIGTDAPTSIGGFAKVLKVEDASNASIVVSGGVHEAEYAVSSSGGWFGTATNIPQRFITNNTHRMTLDADGRLGLGEQQHASAGHRTIEGRVDIRMNQAGVNWTDGNYSEIWDSAGVPGSKFNDTMLHIDTNRAGSTTGGVVGIAFSPGWQGHQNWGIVATNKTGGSYSQGDLSFVSQLNDGSIHERMRLSGAGNIGIGTDSPDNTLHVHKGSAGTIDGNTNAPLTVENSAANYIQMLAPNGQETGILFGNPANSADSGIIHSDANDTVTIRVGNNSNKVIFTGGGDIVAQSATQNRIVLGSTGNSANNSSNWVRGNAGYLQFNSASSGYNWEIAGANKMSMDANGKVTFVASSIDLNNSGTYTVTSQTTGTVIRGAQVRFLKTSDHRYPTQGSMTHGNMGFGFTSYALNNTSPWADIIYLNSYTDASGGSPNAIVVSRSGSNAKIVRYPWSATSSTYISGGTQYGLDSASASDERLKENVNDITDGLAVINSLRPVTFNWTDTYIESGSSKNEEELEVNSETDQAIQMPSSKVENVGLIAQEVEAVVPTVVHEGQISIGGVDYKNVDYKKLVPHLIAAIQEQQALITSLTARVTTLEG